MPPIVDTSSAPMRHCLVDALRQQIAHWERTRRPQETPVSSGVKALDQVLPGGGFHRGTLVEWLAAGDGCGAASLAMVAAREACRDAGALVVLDRTGEFYPPAVRRLGIDPQGLMVVRAANEADHAWALDQALRCPAVAAVVAWPRPTCGRCPEGTRLAAKMFRRLQLAAEQGGSLGLLIRPEQVRHEPSWADVRILVEAVGSCRLSVGSCQFGHHPKDGRVRDADNCQLATDNSFRFLLKVQLLRGRGGAGGGSVEVEIGNETRTLHLASQLAAAADRRRAAGA
jgi:protein ImuA